MSTGHGDECYAVHKRVPITPATASRWVKQLALIQAPWALLGYSFYIPPPQGIQYDFLSRKVNISRINIHHVIQKCVLTVFRDMACIFTCIKHIEIIWKLHIEMTNCIVGLDSFRLKAKYNYKALETLGYHKGDRKLWHFFFYQYTLVCSNKMKYWFI